MMASGTVSVIPSLVSKSDAPSEPIGPTTSQCGAEQAFANEAGATKVEDVALPDQNSAVTEDEGRGMRREGRIISMVDEDVRVRRRRPLRRAIIDLAILLPLTAASLSLCFALIYMFSTLVGR
jgi:hypothetical protein